MRAANMAAHSPKNVTARGPAFLSGMAAALRSTANTLMANSSQRRQPGSGSKGLSAVVMMAVSLQTARIALKCGEVLPRLKFWQIEPALSTGRVAECINTCAERVADAGPWRGELEPPNQYLHGTRPLTARGSPAA